MPLPTPGPELPLDVAEHGPGEQGSGEEDERHDPEDVVRHVCLLGFVEALAGGDEPHCGRSGNHPGMATRA